MMSEQVELGEIAGKPVEAGISERIGKDIVTAMKAKDEHLLTTLRMVKSALKNREIEKRQPLTEAEEQKILTTLVKQRKESVESFTKGDRPELAAREQKEIGMIESYLPQAAGEEEIRAVIKGALNHLAADAGGVRPGPKDIGPAMSVIKQRLMASGVRADGSVVNAILREELGTGRNG